MTQTSIYLQDCVEGMRTMPAESVDVVVTSPPYNLGIKYATHDDKEKRETFLGWCFCWAALVKKVMRPGASFFLNVAGSPSNPYLPFEIVQSFRDLFTLQNTIHWIKSISIEDGDEVVSRGHFKPLSSDRFVHSGHEYVFHFTKDGDVKLDRLAAGVPYADKSNAKRWQAAGGKDRRCRGNTWFIPYDTIQNRGSQRPHPASFPPALAERCLILHGHVPDLDVLDPFLGIGNSAIAARKLGVRSFTGFDIDAGYLTTACERTDAKMLTPYIPGA